MHPKYSFSAGINMDTSALSGLLGSYYNGNRIASYISRVYTENPFRLLLDSDSERKTAENSLRPVVSVIKDAGIEPVFVFDYTCMGDHHLTASFQVKLGRLLGFLDSIGVTSISLSDLYLAETFSSEQAPYNKFNHFRVYLSRRARINHAIKLKYLENIKYSAVTLHPDLNRNIDEIKRAVAFAGAEKIEIVLNSGCFEGCPMEIFCNALRFHLTEEEASDTEEKPVTWYQDKCNTWLESDTYWTQSMTMILPERIGDYINAGVSNFNILNNPHSALDLKNKLTSYVERKRPKDPAVLIFGRETSLAGRWEKDIEKSMNFLNTTGRATNALARFIEG
ncbi:MAG: hypothetical protein LWY06_05600 [Firmicutes bacterium]|nr:hypothetical protein [Bacillota bacterium]